MKLLAADQVRLLSPGTIATPMSQYGLKMEPTYDNCDALQLKLLEHAHSRKFANWQEVVQDYFKTTA